MHLQEVTDTPVDNKNINFSFEQGIISVIPIIIAIEIAVYLVTISTIVSIVLLGTPLSVSIDSLGFILLGIISGKLTFITLVALSIKTCPKPKLGKISNKSEMIKYCLIASLCKLIRRSWTREEFYLFPFPGKLFFTLSGAKIGKNSTVNSPDSLPDPFLVEIGENTVIGEFSILSGHFRPNTSITIIDQIKIGNNVLIGRNSSIWPGVCIGDNAVIKERSSVMPGTIIGSNELWGGTPARNISNKINKDAQAQYRTQKFFTSKNEVYEIALWLISKFIKNTRGLELEDSHFNLSFADSGFLDSLSFLSLIEDLENYFEVSLDTKTLSFYELTPNQLIKAIIGNKFKSRD